MKFGDRYIKFMKDRYGIDELYKFLLLICFVPLKKGKHTVKCPNCGNKFDVACHKDEKIKVEIIK